jgi:hypothetical protein
MVMITMTIVEFRAVVLIRRSIRASQETHYVSVTKIKRFMLFKETDVVASHTKHKNILLHFVVKCRVLVDASG